MDTNVLLVVFLGNRYIEVAPEDVIWANLGMNPYEQKVHFGFSFLPSILCLPPQFDDVEVIPPLLFATDMRLVGGVLQEICFHVMFELMILFFTDSYSYQLLYNRCHDRFLVFPRYVLSSNFAGPIPLLLTLISLNEQLRLSESSQTFIPFARLQSSLHGYVSFRQWLLVSSR